MDNVCEGCLCNSCVLDSDDCPRDLPCLNSDCQIMYDCEYYESAEL